MKRYWNLEELLIWMGISLVGGVGIGMILSVFLE
jgi:hypothetical protein